MNEDIETLEIDRTVYVPEDEFKAQTKERNAKLKVVGTWYRWVAEDAEGLYILRPKKYDAETTV